MTSEARGHHVSLLRPDDRAGLISATSFNFLHYHLQSVLIGVLLYEHRQRRGAIVNAVEAMDSATSGARKLKLRTEVNPGNSVVIMVADTGPGIVPEMADKIFQPFFTTKPRGMGMGLSICKSIIEAHEGRLIATPGELCGAVFWIHLPNATANAEQQPPNPSSTKSRSSREYTGRPVFPKRPRK